MRSEQGLSTPVRFVERQLRARTLAVSGVALLLGVLLQSACRLPLWGSVSVIALALLLIPVSRRRSLVLLVIVGVALPFGLGALRYALQDRAKPLVPSNFSVQFEGDVVSDVTLNSSPRLIAAFHVTRIDDEASDQTVRLYLRSDVLPLEGIAYGQHLSLTGHIWPQEHATNPYEMDQANWLRGIGLQGMAAAKLEDVEVVSRRFGWQTPFIAVKRAIADRIDRLFPRSAALARAFILGDRSMLESDTRAAFNTTGVAHLISLSGMHVAVLAFALQKLLRRFMRRYLADGCALLFIALYAALVGFPPSLVRAALMFAMACGASLCGRPSDGITRLSAALVI
ncbi:MAG: ComEC/Rec2 family competence protein, partial [Clostridiales bacterium]|nr:ComEC/Rec2 family competence protein [Clostridiales bacterium]